MIFLAENNLGELVIRDNQNKISKEDCTQQQFITLATPSDRNILEAAYGVGHYFIKFTIYTKEEHEETK